MGNDRAAIDKWLWISAIAGDEKVLFKIDVVES